MNVIQWLACIQAIVLLAYVVVNGICMGIGVRNTKDLMLRSGMMASVNIVPLFLGGRTSFLANGIGIPLHTYYLAHHWVGRTAIIQGLLHASLAILSSNTVGKHIISGLVVASTFALILFLSLYFVRRFMFELFLKIHLLLAMVAIGSLLWHLLPGGFLKVLFPTIALLLWVLNTLCQLYFSRRAHQAFITKLYSGSNDQQISAIKFKIVLRQSTTFTPGQYFYLRFSSYLRFRDRFQTRPLMITWWDAAPVEAFEEGSSVTPSTSAKGSKRGDASVTSHPPSHTKAKSLTFLIQPQRGLLARLALQSSIRSVILDGPYGQDLHLERYETVMLVAKGIGIAGVLPYARHLANWKLHKNISYKRAVMTRKLDLYWLLEENYQEEWVGDYLKELQQKDIKQIWCYYPSKKNSEPLMKLDKGVPAYQCFYPNSPYKSIPDAIKEVAGKSPGRNIVVACGTPSFTKFIRDDVRHYTSRHNIVEFVEVEYRPQGPHEYLRSKYLSGRKRDTELQILNSHQPLKQPKLAKNVLSKGGESQTRDGNIENPVRVDAAEFV
ncbi:hypothetical protein FGG08_000646 [Glutinoglossum americanum]|uniref:FAD-binding FR-type domain-containing protein n=1 Tax=Glutinoglossum americanum TaxID=1670608 RepID=A0A9P8IG91_9PEZI|nr:hypothetical protein FGG08_000646 [Glutinoglossum americanum]